MNNRLGRGSGSESKDIFLDDIVFNPEDGDWGDNVRTSYDMNGIKELAESIFENKLRNPIEVYPAEEQGKYCILTGHRRFLAFRHLAKKPDNMSFKKIKAKVLPQKPENYIEIQLVENLQREDMSDYEKEKAIGRLKKAKEGLSHEEIGKKIGRSKGWVSKALTCYQYRLEHISEPYILTKSMNELYEEIQSKKRIEKEKTEPKVQKEIEIKDESQDIPPEVHAFFGNPDKADKIDVPKSSKEIEDEFEELLILGDGAFSFDLKTGILEHRLSQDKVKIKGSKDLFSNLKFD